LTDTLAVGLRTDKRVHSTTGEPPIERFGFETITSNAKAQGPAAPNLMIVVLQGAGLQPTEAREGILSAPRAGSR
jgi:hypothetical protein